MAENKLTVLTESASQPEELDPEAVAAALATGTADPERGEAVHLAVVLRSGHHGDAASLKAWAGDHLERYKLPDKIYLVDGLPAGSTGKADRRALRRLIETGKI